MTSSSRTADRKRDAGSGEAMAPGAKRPDEGGVVPARGGATPPAKSGDGETPGGLGNHSTREHDDDGLQLVAVVAVLVRSGRVLAMQRSARKGPAGGGRWETLSGRVAPGEDPYAAVCREIEEESGLVVGRDVRLARTPFDVYVARRVDTPMTVLVYRGEVHGEANIVRSDEHDDHAWLDADELASRPTFARLVQAVRTALS